MRFEELINKYSNKLTNTDLQLLSFILKHKDVIGNLSSQEISDLVYSSPASLTRLAKKLGFKGFSELKYFLKNETSDIKSNTINHTETLIKDMNDTIKLLTQTDLRPLVAAIHDSKRVFLYGTDWGEKRACELLSRDFLACNMLLYTIPSITELKWVLAEMTTEDLLIVVSFSGENHELNNNLLQLSLRKIPYISITPISKNTLSSRATYNLYYSSTKLDISNTPDTEYNYFSPLELIVDALFRYYMDTYYIESKS